MSSFPQFFPFNPNENSGHTPIKAFTSSSSIISDPIYIGNVNLYAITAFWTGSGTGTFSLQSSTDIERVPGFSVVNGIADPGIVNWVTLPDTFLTSVGSPVQWNYSNAGYRWVRIVYTVSTGSITLTETVQLKAI